MAGHSKCTSTASLALILAAVWVLQDRYTQQVQRNECPAGAAGLSSPVVPTKVLCPVDGSCVHRLQQHAEAVRPATP